MKIFCKSLVEKKLNQPRDLHNLPASSLAFTLGDHPSLEPSKVKKNDNEKLLQKEQMIAEKLESIRLRKRVDNLEELNPLMMNIETIFTLPNDIEVTDDGKLVKSTKGEVNLTQLSNDIEKKKIDINKKIEKNPNYRNHTIKQKKELSKFVDELFSDNMDIENWIS